MEVLFVEISQHQALERIFGVEVSTCLILDTILGAGGCDRISLMKVIIVIFCQMCPFGVEFCYAPVRSKIMQRRPVELHVNEKLREILKIALMGYTLPALSQRN
jgi:hypothetical protein